MAKRSSVSEVRDPMTEEELDRLTDPASPSVDLEGASIQIDGVADDRMDDGSDTDVVLDHDVQLDAATVRAQTQALKLVPVRPRKTIMRVRVPAPNGEGALWLNFVQGKEQMVHAYVRDWMFEKGLL